MTTATIAPSETNAEELRGILIVDDDQASGAAIRAAIGRYSFIILGVEPSPRRVLWAASRSRPTLVVMNIRGEWPEGDVVVFQLARAAVSVLVVGDHARLCWHKYRLPGVHHLPRDASAAEIADAVCRVASPDRRVA